MSESVADKITRWSMSTTVSPEFSSLLTQIRYLSDKRFSEYHPTFGPPHKEFLLRLNDWIESAPLEEDQQLLLQLVPEIFFVGSREFASLYRTAMNGIIKRWLIDQIGIKLNARTFQKQLAKAIETTWFCAITDSMQIAAFYHVNNLEGSDVRPEWKSLAEFGDRRRIRKFMRTNGLKRIVLLEDFVGTGTQMSKAVDFAASLSGEPPILVLPLIVGPIGVRTGQRLSSAFSHVSFSTTLALKSEAFVWEIPQSNEGELFQKIRDLVIRIYTTVSGGLSPSPILKPYGPFGFNRTNPKHGALLVMYSNCPDNTLPIIHHSSVSWSPLFPRSSRV